MKTALIGLSLFLLNSTAHGVGGSGVGNSGIGVQKNGVVYLLDLAEDQIEEHPQFPSQVLASDQYNELQPLAEKLDLSLPHLQSVLTEISARKPDWGFLFMKVILSFHWVLSDGPLTPQRDWGSHNQHFDLIQIAVRYAKLIKISRPAWMRMDKANRTALIIHEVLYSLYSQSQENLLEEPNPIKNTIVLLPQYLHVQMAAEVRKALASLFTKSINHDDAFSRSRFNIPRSLKISKGQEKESLSVREYPSINTAVAVVQRSSLQISHLNYKSSEYIQERVLIQDQPEQLTIRFKLTERCMRYIESVASHWFASAIYDKIPKTKDYNSCVLNHKVRNQ